jgi:hypothetical protein
VTDSYRTDLLEPIPISPSSEKFLTEYETKLGYALESFKAAALEDLCSFVRKRAEGPRLAAAVNYATIHASNRRGISSKRKFIDPGTGRHFFRKDGGHPNLLSNVLALCYYEMGGFPRSVDQCEYRKFFGRGTTHWKYVHQFGRNTLLPYLGLPTIYEALAVLILLLIEHPRFNVMSLINGELKDKDGNDQLVVEAGLRDADSTSKRMTVDKWRALSQKTGILSATACRAVQTYLEITAPLRTRLIERGDAVTANFLWVGLSISVHDIVQLHHREFSTAFTHESTSQRSLRTEATPSQGRQLLTFFERHPSLLGWSRTTLKALRVNSGVLKFIQSDGNLAVAVDVFAHSKPATTIRNYIPEALLHQMYERQIRRHQNSLIAWAHPDERTRLQMTDFASVGQLHEFLRSGIPLAKYPEAGEENNAEVVAAATEEINERRASSSELVLMEDVTAIAISLLYREHLRGAPQRFLEKPDAVTNLPPKFWVALVESLTSDLPPALYQVRQLVDQAKMLVPHLATTTHFSEFWQ